MGLRGERRVSARHCRPSPFLSSSSTELTFKLWHQLPCQTRCDFPLLHLPSLLLAQFLLLLLSPPSFPLTPFLSSNRTAASSGVPIHSMPALQEALLQVGIAGLTLAAPPPLAPRWDFAVPKITSARSCSAFPPRAPQTFPPVPPGCLLSSGALSACFCSYPSLTPPKSLRQGCTLHLMFIYIWPQA